jgi:hypothetical protein
MSIQRAPARLHRATAQALALPAADAARDTWVHGFGFTHMTEEQQAQVRSLCVWVMHAGRLRLQGSVLGERPRAVAALRTS